MRFVYVPLREEAIKKLVAIAEREMRKPRDQAALLLIEALKRIDDSGQKVEEPASGSN